MRFLMALALAAMTTPALGADQAPPPPPRPPAVSFVTPALFCRIEGVNPVVVCYDAKGERSLFV